MKGFHFIVPGKGIVEASLLRRTQCGEKLRDRLKLGDEDIEQSNNVYSEC